MTSKRPLFWVAGALATSRKKRSKFGSREVTVRSATARSLTADKITLPKLKFLDDQDRR